MRICMCAWSQPSVSQSAYKIMVTTCTTYNSSKSRKDSTIIISYCVSRVSLEDMTMKKKQDFFPTCDGSA